MQLETRLIATNIGRMNKNDPISYPILTHKSNPNNPFIMFNENNLPNYTNPGCNKRIMINGNNDNDDKMLIDKGTASSISTSFNIIKGIMGVGILTLPWCISRIGLLLSVIFLIISFLLSYICWIFLTILCDKYHVYSYRDIGLVIFGKKFATFLDVILLIFLYLVCILYIVFLSQFIIDGLSQFGILINKNITFINLSSISSILEFCKTKFFIITISTFFILWPLSLLPHLDYLKYSSFLGIIGCFYTIGLIIFTFFDEKDKTGYFINKSVKFTINTTNNNYIWYWLSSFSVFVACFNTHFNCPALYGELKNKTQIKYINISTISFIITLFLNLLTGICGYFTFGINLNENILDTLNYGLIVGIARLIMTLTIIGTYPLLFWNIKISINNLFLYKNITNINHTKIKKMPRKYTCLCSKIFIYFIVTITIWITSIVAFDVAVMITFMQSLLGNAIVFIFPSIFYLQMLKNEKKQNKNITKIFFVTILCYILVTFGIICVIGGCIASIMFWTGYIK